MYFVDVQMSAMCAFNFKQVLQVGKSFHFPELSAVSSSLMHLLMVAVDNLWSMRSARSATASPNCATVAVLTFAVPSVDSVFFESFVKTYGNKLLLFREFDPV